MVTHNRAGRLASLLESLAGQTFETDRFEVIVVDDASSDETQAVLAAESDLLRVALRVVRRQGRPSRAAARNVGWRTARAELIAYIDDDCVATPEWLEEGVRVARAHPDSIVQGRVDPDPDEFRLRSPGTRTQRVHQAGPYFQTCNIFYPRALIEQLGGFDSDAYTRHGGEDTDLAWRAISSGATAAYAPKARVYHAVNLIGLAGRLRFAWHWHESMIVYKRYPALREQVFTKGIFWKQSHYALACAAATVLLPRRGRALAPFLMRPYLRSIRVRLHEEQGTPLHALFYLLEDVLEVLAMLRASAEHQMLVL